MLNSLLYYISTNSCCKKESTTQLGSSIKLLFKIELMEHFKNTEKLKIIDYLRKRAKFYQS